MLISLRVLAASMAMPMPLPLRKISGIVPSIMCMFGFNAGRGSYLPRQGCINPKTRFGLTGPGVVKSVLGEDITPDELGGPAVHGQTGVTDFVVEDELPP